MVGRAIESPNSTAVVGTVTANFNSTFNVNLSVGYITGSAGSKVAYSGSINTSANLVRLYTGGIFGCCGVSSSRFNVSLGARSGLPVTSKLSDDDTSSGTVIGTISSVVSRRFGLGPLSSLRVVGVTVSTSLRTNIAVANSFSSTATSCFNNIIMASGGGERFVVGRGVRRYPVLICVPGFCSGSKSSGPTEVGLLTSLIRATFRFTYGGSCFGTLGLGKLVCSTALNFGSSVTISTLRTKTVTSNLSNANSSFMTITDRSGVSSIGCS